MNKIIIILITGFLNFSSFSQLKEQRHVELVKEFVELIKTNNIDSLSKRVQYPLRREYPLPSIINELGFITNYSRLIDSSFKSEIINTDIPVDWSAVGWRGIMLKHGALWLDSEGNLLAINYESEIEETERLKLIEVDRSNLHESLREFERPLYVFETSKFKIHIDQLKDGSYRYSSWGVKESVSTKPNLVIKNGNWTPDGSGGNNYYTFKNGDYTYQLYIIIIGTDTSPPAELSVYKNKAEILNQSAQIVRR
jgi:hypothetical protein